MVRTKRTKRTLEELDEWVEENERNIQRGAELIVKTRLPTAIFEEPMQGR